VGVKTITGKNLRKGGGIKGMATGDTGRDDGAQVRGFRCGAKKGNQNPFVKTFRSLKKEGRSKIS